MGIRLSCLMAMLMQLKQKSNPEDVEATLPPTTGFLALMVIRFSSPQNQIEASVPDLLLLYEKAVSSIGLFLLCISISCLQEIGCGGVQLLLYEIRVSITRMITAYENN